MHTPKCVHRRQFNIYIKKNERHLDKVDFSFLLHFSCGKAESDIQFTDVAFLLSVASCLHSAVHVIGYEEKRVQYRCIAFFFFDFSIHFVLPYIQSPIKSRKQKQCVKIFLILVAFHFEGRSNSGSK